MNKLTHVCHDYFTVTGAIIWLPQCPWSNPESDCLTHWGRVRHIYVSKLISIGSDNGLSPGRRQAIIWTNAGILSIGPLGTNFSEIWIEVHTVSFKKIHLKMSSGKWRPCCLDLNVLTWAVSNHNNIWTACIFLYLFFYSIYIYSVDILHFHNQCCSWWGLYSVGCCLQCGHTFTDCYGTDKDSLGSLYPVWPPFAYSTIWSHHSIKTIQWIASYWLYIP